MIRMILVALFLFLSAGLASAQEPATPVTPPAADPENMLHLDLSTGGRVSIQLRPDVAPNHVERIKTLARRGFYDNVTFHRVIDGFMAQTGDPTGTGEGDSDLPDLKAEFNALPHVRGAVSAARTDEPDSANSQFFIMFAPRLSLDGRYSVFGRVVSGMEFVDAIERGEPPANPSRIRKASIGSDNVPPPPPEPPAPPPTPPAQPEVAPGAAEDPAAATEAAPDAVPEAATETVPEAVSETADETDEAAEPETAESGTPE